MTLNSRNRLFLISFIIMALQSVALLIAGLIIVFSGQMQPMPSTLPQAPTVAAFFIYDNFHAGIISILIITLYATITGFVLYRRFEKTIASEIIYFAGFLFGVFLENFRICIPLFNLWEGFRPVLVSIGRASLGGRIFALFCMLHTSFPVSENFVQDTDKHIGISAAVAVLFATVVPFSTHTILPSVAVPFTYQTLFTAIQVMLFAVSIITIVYTNRFPRFFGMLAAYAGYLMLVTSSCYLVTISGTILLLAGTILFLNKLHAFYLWK